MYSAIEIKFQKIRLRLLTTSRAEARKAVKGEVHRSEAQTLYSLRSEGQLMI